MKILVIGGAWLCRQPYVRQLMAAGHEVWIYDNLSRGHRQCVPPDGDRR